VQYELFYLFFVIEDELKTKLIVLNVIRQNPYKALGIKNVSPSPQA
jgi:hypothetical protein